MSTPVRLTLAQQVEHWAQLGRAVEAVLAVASVGRLKDLSLRPDLDELLAAAQTAEGRSKALELIATRGLPAYSADPDCHDGVIEHRLDGTSVRGRFVNRVFIAEDEHADEAS